MQKISWFLSVLLGSLIGIGAFFLLATNGYLDSRYRAYVVTSGSMAPTIEAGSVLISKSEQNYTAGDVVTFKNGARIITHRIFKIKDNEIITKGDANEDPDFDVIPNSHIIGRKLISVPHVGYAIDFVKSPRGFVMLVIIPASIIVYEELKNLGSEIRKKFGRLGLAAALVLLVGTTATASYTNSYLSDFEESNNNLIQAADSFYQNLVINEFLPDPDTQHPNEWVELYNPNDFEIDLTGWSLKDETNTPKPLTGTIQANGYFVYEPPSHWLNNDGDEISLLNEDNEVIDQKSYSASDNDISYGRHPDGENWRQCDQASKGSSNNNVCNLEAP